MELRLWTISQSRRDSTEAKAVDIPGKGWFQERSRQRRHVKLQAVIEGY
jgi:hypothetical protein